MLAAIGTTGARMCVESFSGDLGKPAPLFDRVAACALALPPAFLSLRRPIDLPGNLAQGSRADLPFHCPVQGEGPSLPGCASASSRPVHYFPANLSVDPRVLNGADAWQLAEGRRFRQVGKYCPCGP